MISIVLAFTKKTADTDSGIIDIRQSQTPYPSFFCNEGWVSEL